MQQPQFINGHPIPTFVNAWKNIEFFPETTVFPRSVDEVVDIVNLARKWGRRLKPVGGAHGFNNNIRTSGMLVDLRHMNKVLGIEGEVAHVEAGITIAQIISALDPEGLHFPALGSWSSQTIAGAIATSTHSSTLHHPSLADIVEEVEVVLSDGSVHTYSGQTDEARALRASFGQIGIVTKVKARFTPGFFLECNTHSLPEEEGFRSIVSIAREHEYVNMLWLPYLGETCVRILTRSDATEANEAAKNAAMTNYRLMRWDETVKDLRDYFDGTQFMSNPQALAVPYSLKYRDAFYADNGMIDKSYNIFRYDKYGEPTTNHYLRMILNSEHAIDVERLEGVLFQLRDVISDFARRGQYINWPRLHMRFTQKSDRTLIGLNTDRETAYVGIYVIGTIHHATQIELCRAIEAVLIANEGRPHWGKFRYTPDNTEYISTYSNYQTFLDVRARLDPTGMFSEDLEPHSGLNYFIEQPTMRMLQSLFDQHTYFGVELL